MNLATTLELYCYGTSEGVRKEWDERGRTTSKDKPDRGEIVQTAEYKAFLDIDGSLVGQGQEHEDTLRDLGVKGDDEDLERKVDEAVRDGVVRLCGLDMPNSPLYVQISKKPTQEQRDFIGKAIRKQGGVIYDIAPKGMLRGKRISGEGILPSDFFEKVDKAFK